MLMPWTSTPRSRCATASQLYIQKQRVFEDKRNCILVCYFKFTYASGLLTLYNKWNHYLAFTLENSKDHEGPSFRQFTTSFLLGVLLTTVFEFFLFLPDLSFFSVPESVSELKPPSLPSFRVLVFASSVLLFAAASSLMLLLFRRCLLSLLEVFSLKKRLSCAWKSQLCKWAEYNCKHNFYLTLVPKSILSLYYIRILVNKVRIGG